jgi:hypothetical protein
MQSEEKDLRQRTKEFALQIIRLFSEFPKTTEAQVLGKQVLRSGTSVGANYREAYRARSRAEWSEWDERHARQRREGSGSESGGERMNLSRNAAIHCVNSRKSPMNIASAPRPCGHVIGFSSTPGCAPGWAAIQVKCAGRGKGIGE